MVRSSARFCLASLIVATTATTVVAGQARPSQAEAVKLLASSDVATVNRGIQMLSELGTSQAVIAIGNRIREGLPPELLDAALVAIQRSKRAQAGRTLSDLARHRRASVRAHVAEAVAECNAQGGEQVLVTLLDDPDAKVRAAAAQGLAKVGTRKSIEPLLLAFEHDVPGADVALAKHAQGAELDRWFAYVDKRPLSSMAAGLQVALARTDLPATTRQKMVAKLKELNSPEVGAILAGKWQGAEPTKEGPVRSAKATSAPAMAAPTNAPAKGASKGVRP